MNFIETKDSILSGDKFMDYVSLDKGIENPVTIPKTDKFALASLLIYA